MNNTKKLILCTAICAVLQSSVTNAGDVEISLPAATDAFTVDQPAGTELMRVHGDGNVGIGTSSPTSLLHIVDSGTAYQTQFLIENKNSSIPNLLDYKGGYFWQKTAFDNFNGEPRFMLARSRGTLDAPTANQDGDLIGQIEFRAYDGGVHRRGASMRAEVDGTVAASNMPSSLHFLTEPEGGSDLVERMVIRSDGNVGIGTTSPVELLNIVDDVDATLRVQGTNGAKGGVQVQDGPRVFEMRGGDGVDFVQVGQATRMTIDFSGNVGVGNTTPVARLDVGGNIKVGDATLPCDASTEGQIRYEATGKKHQGCNGSAWTNLY